MLSSHALCIPVSSCSMQSVRGTVCSPVDTGTELQDRCLLQPADCYSSVGGDQQLRTLFKVDDITSALDGFVRAAGHVGVPAYDACGTPALQRSLVLTEKCCDFYYNGVTKYSRAW